MAIAVAQKSTKHERLKRSPLVLVVAQVRFPTVLRVSDRDFVAPFQEAIRASYPVASEEQEIQMVIGPHGAQQLPGQKQWRFHSRDSQCSLVLSDTAFTLETRNYKDADDFLGRFSEALAALELHVKPALCDRIGLRYVNEIRQPQATNATSWHGLIDPAFLGPIDGELGRRYQVARTIEDISIARGPDEFISLKHGFLPEGTTIVPTAPNSAAPVVGPFYLLDIDHFLVRRGDFDVAFARETLEKFHSVIYDLFRIALTEQLYRRLEPSNG